MYLNRMSYCDFNADNYIATLHESHGKLGLAVAIAHIAFEAAAMDEHRGGAPLTRIAVGWEVGVEMQHVCRARGRIHRGAERNVLDQPDLLTPPDDVPKASATLRWAGSWFRDREAKGAARAIRSDEHAVVVK